jgi:hypothetical protein
MPKLAIVLLSGCAIFALAGCSEDVQTVAFASLESGPAADAQAPALETLIATPVKRDPVFFANHDFSERQADYLKAHLDALPEADKGCVEDNLRASFDDRMAVCESSGKWTFLCQGCERISDSILYDPAAIVTGMKVCGVDFELPEWQ